MLRSTLRITVILAYFAVAGAMGGYIGARIASTEILRVAFDNPKAPAPRQWADI